ncbi:unnamed protein product [Mesocestoides corti]|uniref:Uncharacterized protein n=1 Tax=Mesocestoides corti TaxID=53468 RepID=A0A0R3UEQ3_MESCO|nr:unnamed protein product [Mesocestoides corti]
MRGEIDTHTCTSACPSITRKAADTNTCTRNADIRARLTERGDVGSAPPPVYSRISTPLSPHASASISDPPLSGPLRCSADARVHAHSHITVSLSASAFLLASRSPRCACWKQAVASSSQSLRARVSAVRSCLHTKLK